MVFFTAKCKAVSMMDLPREEAAENTKNEHRWYFYFDEKPNITQTEACQQRSNKNDANDNKTSQTSSLF